MYLVRSMHRPALLCTVVVYCICSLTRRSLDRSLVQFSLYNSEIGLGFLVWSRSDFPETQGAVVVVRIAVIRLCFVFLVLCNS